MRSIKNKRGFTLIELLAVILILGVIALIAVPTITSVIEDSKKAAIKATASTLIDAAEKQCQVEQMKNQTITSSYTIVDGKISKELDIKNYPQSGQITVDDECNAEVAINDGTYCTLASRDNSTVTSDITNCTLDNMPIPDTSESCFIFNETTRTITGYDYNNTSCSRDIVIPATINNIPVEHIDDFAFYDEEYDYIMSGEKYIFGEDYDVYSAMPGNVTILEHSSLSFYPINIINSDIQQVCYTDANLKNYVNHPLNYNSTEADGYYLCYIPLGDYMEDKDFEYVMTVGNITGLDLSKATNLKSIGDGAFMYNSIERVKFGTLPNLTSLGVSAFDSNQITGTVDLSGLSSLTNISASIFYNNAIQQVKLADNIKSIDDFALADNLIEQVTLPSNLTTIGAASFSINLISSLTIPSSVKTIGEFAFYDSGITTLTLNEGLENIDGSAFASNLISSLTIPSSVKTIGELAFYESYMDDLVIPSSVVSIGYGAFENNNLTKLVFQGQTLADKWAFAEGLKTIDTVVLPDNWTIIPAYLFNNTKINNLTIGKNVQTIQNSAFDCSYIKNITWGDSLETIGDYAFNYINVQDLILPNTVKTIGIGSFFQPSSKTIVIPDSVTTIGLNAFQRQNADSITIGSGIQRIHASAFRCSNASCHAVITVDVNEGDVAEACWSAADRGYGTATITWKNAGPYLCKEYNQAAS